METYKGICKHCGGRFTAKRYPRHEGRPPLQFCSYEHKEAFEEKKTRAAHPPEMNQPDPTPQPSPATAVKNYRKPSTSKSEELNFRCPSPYKQSFINQQVAQDFIDTVHPYDDHLMPYTCRCGAIHIGHSSHSAAPERGEYVVTVRNQPWCAYPKKPGFKTEDDARTWAMGRMLPEHITPFTCTCGYVHLHISKAGEQYRKSARDRSRSNRK